MRQKKLDRAPATVVSNLPERVWTPEGWEKDDDDLIEVVARLGGEDPTTNEETPLLPLSETTEQATSATLSVTAVKPTNLAEDGQPEATSSTPAPQATRNKYYSKDECAICLQPFQRGEKIRILPCGHIFHKEEVDDWLIRWKKLCPICRTDVTQPFPPVRPTVSTSPSSTSMETGNDDQDSMNGALVVPPTLAPAFMRRFIHYITSAVRRDASGIDAESDAVQPAAAPTESTPLIRRQ